MKNKINHPKGFTLIELLVVIAIIGMLSTLAVVSLNNARLKSRDARRISDVKQIQTALELYYNDVTSYPNAVASGGTIVNGTVTYMSVVPTNPTPNGATYTYRPCNDTNCTTAVSPFNSYTLTYNLEGISGGIAAGGHTATPAGIVNP